MKIEFDRPLVRIRGYPNYGITEQGQVWSYQSHKWLKPWQRNKHSKHLVVDLGRDHRYVHQLVLETFVGLRPEGMECRHLDGDPTNNHLENLKWGTRSENQKDAVKHGTHVYCDNNGEANGQSKLTASDVKRIIWCHFKCGISGYKLAKIYGVSNSNITRLLNQKNWKSVWSDIQWT